MRAWQPILQTLKGLFSHLGLRGALIVIVILVTLSLFLVPLAPWLLDLLLVTNIVLALVLLVRALVVNDPVRLFSFPAILLAATLFRLALNVSSTRLILLYGDQSLAAAGRVIESFGTFVVMSDFLVGVIIFLVIAVVNFLVIAKGSARVAEVSARFNLDALPGKQLAIDADVRNGQISKEEAHERRAELVRESQFYGSMDGAMRFVQGDAVAGLVITAVNAIGGVSIGVSRGMSIGEAIDTFGILTIGDGLVSILPCLLISICAGIIVTNVKGKRQRSTGEEMFAHVFAEPQALVVAALPILVMGLSPWFPFLPFFVVAMLMLFVAGFQQLAISSEDFEAGDLNKVTLYGLAHKAKGKGLIPSGDEDYHYAKRNFLGHVSIEPLSVEVGSNLIGAFEDSFEEARIKRWNDIFRSRGVQLPSVILRRGQLPADALRILIRENVVRDETLNVDEVFIITQLSVLRAVGANIKSVAYDPLSAAPGAWLKSNDAAIPALEHLKLQVCTPVEYFVRLIAAAALDAVDELVGLEDIGQLVDSFRQQHPTLMGQLLSAENLSLSEFAECLRRLARESVSIRDLELIVEGALKYTSLNPKSALDGRSSADYISWFNGLHEHLRKVLSRSIIIDALGGKQILRAFLLSSGVEDELRQANSDWQDPIERLPLAPEVSSEIRSRGEILFQPAIEHGALPVVVLCPSEIRMAVQELFYSLFPNRNWLRAIALEELSDRTKLELVGILTMP